MNKINALIVVFIIIIIVTGIFGIWYICCKTVSYKKGAIYDKYIYVNNSGSYDGSDKADDVNNSGSYDGSDKADDVNNSGSYDGSDKANDVSNSGSLSFNAKVNISCIGDSITYGDKIKRRVINSYPSQLGEILNETEDNIIYDVMNYGVNGTTMLRHSCKPYVESSAYNESLKKDTDIAVIMLGTNDTNEKNRDDLEVFERDTVSLINEYQALNNYIKIIIMTPASQYIFNDSGHESYNMSNDLAEQEAELIKNKAKSMHITCVDIHLMTANHPEWYVSDGIHINKNGAHEIALVVSEAIKMVLKD